MSTKQKYVFTLQDRQNAKRLRSLWDTKKRQLELTQQKAALICGISQPAFNQYINAVMPLNTDMIFKFATLLKVSPADIAPELKDITPLFSYSKVSTLTITLPILGSMSGRKTMQQRTVTLDTNIANKPHTAGFVLDTDSHAAAGYPKGSTLVVDLLDNDLRANAYFVIRVEGEVSPRLINVLEVDKLRIVATDTADGQPYSIMKSTIDQAFKLLSVVMG